MTFNSKFYDKFEYMTSPNITVPHAFTTRFGGVSQGIFESFNLGENTGDDHANIAENYRILCSALDIPDGNLVFSRQVHEADVRVVGYDDRHELFAPVPYAADGLVTDKTDLALVIFTADCIPVLLHDPVKNVIGAVHCGWRGTMMDIAGEAVRVMKSEFGCDPSDIRAAVGPGISLCCFETGDDVADAAKNVLPDCWKKFVFPKENGKFMVDLKGVNRQLMENMGVLPENIEISDECTMCSHEKYWSHRYTKGQRGSQASVIMLKGSAAN